jgi:hypothetical protein
LTTIFGMQASRLRSAAEVHEDGKVKMQTEVRMIPLRSNEKHCNELER